MINYKDIFVDLLRKTNDLESGRIFLASKAGPAEINAIASYKNIIATGEQNIYTHKHTNTNHILY